MPTVLVSVLPARSDAVTVNCRAPLVAVFTLEGPVQARTPDPLSLQANTELTVWPCAKR